MTYTVVQKVKGKYYLCEVDATWDPVKKNSKQTRRYLGRCDKDGNLLDASQKLSVTAIPFGQYYLMFKMAEKCGAIDACIKAFGPENGRRFVALAITRTLRTGRLASTQDQVNESFLPMLLGIPGMEEWSDLQTMLMNLEGAYSDREDLFRALASGKRAAIMEVGALREGLSYRDLEGSSPNETTYRLVNFPKSGMLVSVNIPEGMPFGFQLIQGSDVSRHSIEAAYESVRSMTDMKVEFFLGSKQWDEEKAKEMLSLGYLMTFPVSSESKLGKGILADSNRIFRGSANTYVFNGTVFRIAEMDACGGRAVVILNEKRRNDELLTFYSELEDFETRASQIDWSDDAESVMAGRHDPYGVSGLFTYSEKDGKIAVSRKRKAVTAIENRCGKTVILTNTDHDWKEIILQWRKHAAVEYCMRIFKTDLEGSARLFPSLQSAYGALLMEVVSMSIQSRLVYLLDTSSFAHRLDLMTAIAEMEKLKVVKINEEWKLGEISPFQKSIMEAVGVEIPTDSMVRDAAAAVGKRCGVPNWIRSE